MKSIIKFSFVFLLAFLASCSLGKKYELEKLNKEVKAVSIKTFSRGVYDSIVMKSSSLEKFSFSESKYKKDINSKQWSHLLDILQENKIKPEMLKTFESNGNGHHSDKSYSEILYIVTDNNTFKTNTYDASNPPSEIKDLLEYIKSIKIK